MGRRRIYTDATERSRAYRARASAEYARVCAALAAVTRERDALKAQLAGQTCQPKSKTGPAPKV
jgi:hypothetical protein